MRFVLAIDYDGTMFEDGISLREAPVLGAPIMPVIRKVQEFSQHPHCDVILWTCREERLLVEAIERCAGFGIFFHAVNMNTQETLEWNKRQFGRQGNTCGRKVFADLYVDDRSPGSVGHFLALDPEVEWRKVSSRNA